MNTLSYGSSGLRGTRLAYGCWRIAGTWNPQEVSPEREEHGRQSVLAAFEAGYRVFDLANIYCEGAAERIFGNTLAAEPSIRDQITLITKCGIRKKGEPEADSPYRYDFTASHIVESCEHSLKRLRTETVDLFLLHRPDYLMDPDQVAQAFSSLKDSGKVRAFGVSNFRPAQVELLRSRCPMPLVAHQLEFSLLHLDPLLDGTLEQCQSTGMVPMAWSPLGAGRLAASGSIELHDPNHARRIKLRETLDQLARVYDVSRNVIALAWLLRHPAQVQPIVGSTNPARIKECAAADQLELSREEWYLLLESALGHRLP